MTDSTAVFGKLMMPAEPFVGVMEVQSVSWGDTLINGVALILAVLFILVSIRDYYRMFPTLWEGVFRNKKNVLLEDSIEQIKTRNRLSIPFLFALCLVIDRFLMTESNLPDVIIAFLFYWIYKFIIAKRIKAKRVDLNITIVMTSVLLLTWAVLGLFKVDNEASKNVIIIEMSFFYTVQILREIQFLRVKYPAFRTFLYLCALEFLPLGVLILIWPQ